MDLKDKVIAITGGGQGLGRAMAVGIATKGARLALLDLNEAKLEETVQLCRAAGGDACSYLVNIAQEIEVEDTFNRIMEEMGALHGLINNAGILRDGLLIKTQDGQITKRLTLDEWQAVIDVNLTGVFICGREAATKMIESQTKGVIINIASISKAGNMGQSNYSAAKAGVEALTVTWAKELARYGIRTGAIAPGFIATEMVASMKPEALEKMTSFIPLKRMGKPEEIAHTAVYILENDYFSGRTIEVDAALRL